MVQKSKHAFRTISEVADELSVPQHVLRFWETKFKQIKPLKRGGNRRYYRPSDVELLHTIQHLLYTDGMTIKGAQKTLKEKGVKGVVAAWKREAGIKEEKPAPKRKEAVAAPRPAKAARPARAAAKEAEAAPAGPAGDDHVKVSKDLVKALVSDLRALRDLINRLPD